MNEYLLEDWVSIQTFWKISFEFEKINCDDIIEVDRSNENIYRYFKLKITNNKIEYNNFKSENYDNIINHSIQFNDINYCTITWKSLTLCELCINDNIFNLGFVYCDWKTVIKSTCNVFNYKVEYLNFNEEIPRVYGDCFTQIYTHKRFGKYCYELGANYFTCGAPHLTPEYLTDRIIEHYNEIPNNNIYLFRKAFINNKIAKDCMNYYISRFKKANILNKITFCTMPCVFDDHNNIWNDLVKNYKYIDFAKDFENLDNIENYFEDYIHTNKLGAKILFERIKIDAPLLCKKYNIKY